MPNWCSNHYAFYTDDENKDELLRLYNKLSDIMEIPSEIKNDFEPGWLGKVATEHGLDFEKISCRGWIEHLEDYEPESNFFTLQSETAWAPTDELWQAVVAQYEGVYFVYVAEEPGFEVFINSDSEGVYFPDKYLIEVHGDIPIPEGWYPDQDKLGCLDIREYFSDFEELADYCADFTGREFSTLEELQGYLSGIFDEEDNAFACIREFVAA